MRGFAVGVIGALAATLLVWLAWASLPAVPVAAGEVVDAVNGIAADAVTEAVATGVRAEVDAPSGEPTPEPQREELAPLPLQLPDAPLELHWVEAGSRVPLPGLDVKVWSWTVASSTEPIDLTIDARGRATLARALLRDASGIQFEVALPEFATAISLKPALTIEALRVRVQPVVVEVPRGHAREVRVVDALGAAIAGAWLEAEPVRKVTTDAQGLARPVLTVPPPSHVTVSAAGYREDYVAVPPADEPWVVELQRANRLELELAAGVDLLGHHAIVRLPRSFTQRTFYQSHYVRTPGHAVEGTPGLWSSRADRSSIWELGFPASRVAVVDQLYDSGAIEVELWRYDRLLDRRAVELPAAGGCTHVVLLATLPPTDAELQIVDDAGRPIAGARVRLGAELGAELAPSLDSGLPIWAPDLHTDANGRCRAPVPTSPDTRVVVAAEGRALAVSTWREVAAADHRIALAPGCTVELEYVDRDGMAMIENACGSPAHVTPRVWLPHGLWLGAADPGNGVKCTFTGLPAATVTFHFTYLREVLHHDARVPHARFVSRQAVDDLELGK